MPLVVPVKFTYASRDLWFDPQDLDILEADYAICSTERGTELGRVPADPLEVPPDESGPPPQPVLRVASERRRCSRLTPWSRRTVKRNDPLSRSS